jgi:hypothetical protein
MKFFMRTPHQSPRNIERRPNVRQRSRPSEFKLIRVAHSFAWCNRAIFEVFVAEMPLRCGSVRLTQTNPRYPQFHRGSCWRYQPSVTRRLQLLLPGFVTLRACKIFNAGARDDGLCGERRQAVFAQTFRVADAACRRDALRIANSAVLMVISTGVHRLIENKQRGVVSGILGISGKNHRRVIQNETPRRPCDLPNVGDYARSLVSLAQVERPPHAGRRTSLLNNPCNHHRQT